MRRLALSSVFVACGMLFGQAAAVAQDDPTTYTRESFSQWLAASKDAKPDFKPGDVPEPRRPGTNPAVSVSRLL